MAASSGNQSQVYERDFIEPGIIGGSFIFEVDGVSIGRFMEVSGLEVSMEVYPVKEGGVNTHVHKLPGRLEWPNIVLRRGVTRSNQLFEWMHNVGAGLGPRGDKTKYQVSGGTGAITLTSDTGERLRTWKFEDAMPVKWTGPKFATDSSDVPQEQLEIAHSGFVAENFG